jgi:hypothetical protein
LPLRRSHYAITPQLVDFTGGRSRIRTYDPRSARPLQAARRQRAQTVDRLVAEYAQALPRRPKLRGTGLPSPVHVADELAQVRAAVAAVEAGARPVSAVTAADVRGVTAALADRPATAGARFGALSRFFDWCPDEEHIQANPCAMVARARRPKAVPARAHFLTVPELAELWRAAEKLAPCRGRQATRRAGIPGATIGCPDRHILHDQGRSGYGGRHNRLALARLPPQLNHRQSAASGGVQPS